MRSDEPAAAAAQPVAPASLLIGALAGAAAASLVAVGVIIGLWRVGIMFGGDDRVPPLIFRTGELQARLAKAEAALAVISAREARALAEATELQRRATETGARISIQPGGAWQVAAVADFNGDGKADVLWRHGVAGTTNVYFMDGATVLGGNNTSQQIGPEWQVQGVGDFNGDGRSDILWRRADGAVSIWLMDGAAVIDRK